MKLKFILWAALGLSPILASMAFCEDVYAMFMKASAEERRNMFMDEGWRKKMASLGTPPATACVIPVPRWVGGNGVKNCRDIGGWKGLGGKRVRTGMIYRSAHLQSIKDVPAFLKQCPVKTDLDLRKDKEMKTLGGKSPLGESVRWYNAPMSAYNLFDSNGVRARVAKAFRVFLCETNYPVIVHCAKGADRTGCIVAILNGLLGVSEEDLTLDWELTAFFNPNPKFRHAERMDKFLETFRTFQGETLTDKFVTYVKSCGFTDADIEKFRSIMLEDNPTSAQPMVKSVPAWQIEGMLPASLAKFASREEEKAAIARVVAPIAQEPEPQAKVVYVDGKPKISLNGKLMNPTVNQSGDQIEYAINGAIKASSLGFWLHQIKIRSEEYEEAPGQYEFKRIGRRIGKFLTKVPDARILLSIHLKMPKFTEANPECKIAYAAGPINETKGGDELKERVTRPSIASVEYRNEVCRFFVKLGEYVRNQPWGKRVVAVRPCWGIYTEWHMYGMYEGADVGPAMTAAFRKWKGGKYANENVPSLAERDIPLTAVFEPEKHEKLFDFYECQANEVADGLLDFAAAVKKNFPGRLVGAYYGYVLAAHPPEGATVLLDKVLSSENIDFLSDPAMYNVATRRAGGAYYHRTMTSTFHRYGKLSLLEDDMRFHHLNGFLRRNQNICTADPIESRMTMRRNWLNQYFDGCGIQILDPSLSRKRPFSFDTPVVWQAIDESALVLEKIGARNEDSRNDVAVVVDWRPRLKRANRPDRTFNLPYAEVPPWIYASGAAVDFMTLDDFLAQKEGRYAKAVFLNVYGGEKKMMGRLAKRTSAKGFKSVWLMRAPSSCIGNGADAKVLDPVPRGAEAWRRVFADLGTPLYAPAGHLIRKHGDVLMFHTGKTGRHELDFVGYSGAEELYSGKRYSSSKISVETTGPDTMLFKLLK